VVALITIEVHACDVIDRLCKANCSSINDFEWVSQLRFYWDSDQNDCLVKQVLSVFTYGYEYQGNNGRLVITPLTDRCAGAGRLAVGSSKSQLAWAPASVLHKL
jgi:dynein heavy chain